jgi:tetratricopeptide (TPR) repeat protein
LRSLTLHDSATVVHATSHDTTLPAHVEQRILAKAEGNPFFLEELTRVVIEHGDLHTDITVPDTIQDVLMARLDRLPEEHKRLLQTAAVLGRAFAPRLLQALWEEPTPLETLLLDLKRLEFLYERARGERPLYVFKHALTQEVAYDSLLTTRRQVLHAAAGHAMERLYPDWLAEHYEALAHHFTRGAVWEKAFDYLTKSGEKARQAYANQEALAFYTQAIEVSRRITPALDDAQLLPVYEGRGLVWMLMTKYDEAIADFQMMRDLAQTLGNPHQEGESLCHLATAHTQKFTEDQLPLVEHYAQEAQQLAQRLGASKILARSLAIRGQVEAWRGNVKEADWTLAASLQISRREGYKDTLVPTLQSLSSLAYMRGHCQSAIHCAQEGVTVARDIHDGFHELRCLANLSLAQWSRGDYPQAFSVTHEVLIKANERQSMLFLSRMKNHLGWFYRELGAVSRAAACDHESTDLGRTHSITNVEISALINLGLDYLALGQHERAGSYLTSTLDRVIREAVGSHRWRWQIRLFIGLAELSYTTGAYDQALPYVEEGLQEAQRTSSQKYVALGWALRGKVAAKLGDRVSAGTELQQAFSLADQLQSPSLLYPIAYDLGRWYETTGKEREAAALYGKAKATIEQMATAVEDEALRSTFLQSALVQEIHERAARLGE